MNAVDPHLVSSLADLRTRYREPAGRARDKEHDYLDAGSIAFIARSPFVLLATADAAGNCDVSPRGGPPGFVTVLDETHLALPDLNGNNRLDSYRNILENPNAGLLFVVPGKEETVRVNGAVELTDAPEVLDRCTEDLRRPKLALVLTVREVFGHCAKAFLRARLWQPESWADVADAPDLVGMRQSMEDVADPVALRRGYDQSYVDDLARD